LIKIFPEIKKKFKDAKLIIVGSGPQMNHLQKLIDEKGLDEDIALTGKLDNDLVMRYKKVSDVFVLNTAYEGMSHHILEVMNVGIPIVTTNVGGNPELIENGKTGLLTEYNNEKELEKAIIRLLDDKDYGNRLAGEAKKKVQEFSEERMMEETANMLKTI
jgi:glycosyltransferase involved in cell wall biosynthesis